jgi:predicted MFS family arabinose efflux permease
LRRVKVALASPRLRPIILAYAINRTGEWFGLLALVLSVYDHTHSALAVSGILFASQAVPAFAVPALVARVEASHRRRELSGLYLVEAVATAAMAALVAYGFSLPALLVLVAVDGTAAMAASALLRSETARAARADVRDTGIADPDGELATEAERRANGALNVAFSVTFVVGPALGGAVVAVAGAPLALLIDVVSFVICGILLVHLHPHVEEAAGDSVRARLGAAWHYVDRVKMLRWLLLAETVALIFINTGAPIEVSLVKETLKGGDGGVGLLLTMWGVGAVAGSLAFERLIRRPLSETLAGGTMLIGAAFVGLAASPTLAVACVAGVVGGVGNALQWPSLFSLVQRLTPDDLQGRLLGAVESLTALTLAIGLPLGGGLVAATDPRVAFVIVGAGTLLSTAALLPIAVLALARSPREARAPADGAGADHSADHSADRSAA